MNFVFFFLMSNEQQNIDIYRSRNRHTHTANYCVVEWRDFFFALNMQNAQTNTKYDKETTKHKEFTGQHLSMKIQIVVLLIKKKMNFRWMGGVWTTMVGGWLALFDCRSHLVWAIQIEWICYNYHSYSILSQNMD